MKKNVVTKKNKSQAYLVFHCSKTMLCAHAQNQKSIYMLTCLGSKERFVFTLQTTFWIELLLAIYLHCIQKMALVASNCCFLQKL